MHSTGNANSSGPAETAMAPAPWVRGLSWALIAAVLLLALVQMIRALNALPAADDSLYMALATSLIETGELRNIHRVSAPVHTLAPPLWPALLAPWVHVFGRNVVLLKILTMCWGLAALLLAYLAFRPTAGRFLPVGAVLLTALNPMFTIHATIALTDVPFMALSAAWMCLACRTGPTPSKRMLVLIGGVAGLGGLLRTAGLSLVVATGLWALLGVRGATLAWRRRLLNATIAVFCAGVLVVPWAVRGHLVGNQAVGYTLGPEGAKSLSGMPSELRGAIYEKVVTQIKLYVEHLARNLRSFAWLRYPDTLGFALVAVVGIVFLIRLVRVRSPIEWFVLVYGGMLLVFGRPLDRYLMPVLPIAFLYVLLAFRWLGTCLDRRLRRDSTEASRSPCGALVTTILVGLMVLHAMQLRLPTVYPGVGYDADWHAAHRLLTDVGRRMEPDEPLVFARPEMAWAWTGHSAWKPGEPLWHSDPLQWLRKRGVRFVVVVWQSNSATLVPRPGPGIRLIAWIRARHPEAVRVIGQEAGLTAYEILPAAPATTHTAPDTS